MNTEEIIYLSVSFIIILYAILLQYKIWKLEIKNKVYEKKLIEEIARRHLLEKILNLDEKTKQEIEKNVKKIIETINI